MAAMLKVAGLLIIAFLAVARCVEPECPLLKCQAGYKVACFIDDELCDCSCVTDADPCSSLRNNFCPEAHSLCCTSDAATCKCRCGLYRVLH